MLRADATDPDGDPLTITWSATGGTLAATRGVSTDWRAETAPGLVTFTASVDDGRGGRASDTVTIEVSGGEDTFEDVLFDFDWRDPASLPLRRPARSSDRACRSAPIKSPVTPS